MSGQCEVKIRLSDYDALSRVVREMFEMYAESPLLSRCFVVPMTSKGLSDAFASRAAEIADKEGLNGKPAQWYKRLAMDHRNNMRAMLSAIETGAALE